MPHDRNLAPPSVPTSIGAALLEEARQAGLLGDKTEHVSFRAPKALVDCLTRFLV